MKPNEPPIETWQVLKPGSLVHFATRENAKVSRRQWIRAGSLTSALVLAGILFSFRDSGSTEPNYGGIRCSVVRSKAKAHLSGKLDAATDSKITQHLQQCSLCASYMQQTAKSQAKVVKKPQVHYVTAKAEQR
jgi:hypothetical protein